MDEISYSGDQPRKTRRLSRRALLFLALFLAALLLVGGVAFFVFRNSTTQEESGEIEIPTTAPTQAPTEEQRETPTPTVSARKSTLRVVVQNGSGQAGVAADAAAILRTAGYNVVSTANADNFEYEGVTIQIKNSKKSLLGSLEDDLSGDYTITDTSTDLSEDETFDALVIVGS